MGIYVFTTEYLVELLTRDASVGASAHDFGKDILPTAVREGRVGAFRSLDEKGAPGYWRDVGTLDSYWGAHMELLDPAPAMDLYDEEWPIHTMATVCAPASDCRRCRPTCGDQLPPRRRYGRRVARA